MYAYACTEGRRPQSKIFYTYIHIHICAYAYACTGGRKFESDYRARGRHRSKPVRSLLTLYSVSFDTAGGRKSLQSKRQTQEPGDTQTNERRGGALGEGEEQGQGEGKGEGGGEQEGDSSHIDIETHECVVVVTGKRYALPRGHVPVHLIAPGFVQVTYMYVCVYI